MRQIGSTILVPNGRKCDHCERGPIRIITDSDPKRRTVDIDAAGKTEILSWVKCKACKTYYQKKILYDTFPADDPDPKNSLGNT